MDREDMCNIALSSNAILQHDPFGYVCKFARMEERDEIRRYVAELSEQTGLSLTALAKRAGVSSTTLTRFMNSDDVDHVLSSVTLGKLRRLARMAAGTPLISPSEGSPEPRAIVVREYDVGASAGHGAEPPPLQGDGGETPILAEWSMPADLVRAHTSPGCRLALIRVEGDSMEPDYRPGERVMVDLSRRKPSPPGVFVVWDGLGLLLKRVELVPHSDAKRIRLSSINESYAPYEIDLDEHTIIARVVGKWVWK
jgi:transcriptional regulator with XRE-family HTH domain